MFPKVWSAIGCIMLLLGPVALDSDACPARKRQCNAPTSQRASASASRELKERTEELATLVEEIAEPIDDLPTIPPSVAELLDENVLEKNAQPYISLRDVSLGQALWQSLQTSASQRRYER